MTGPPDPFTALGLTAGPDLTDEQVRTAWRAIAAATHPDRADRGDPPAHAPAPAGAGLRPRRGRWGAWAASPAARDIIPFPPRVLPPPAPAVNVTPWRAF